MTTTKIKQMIEVDGVILTFTEKEKARCIKACNEIIDYLKPLAIKEQYLVAETLYATFPKKELKR